MQSTALDCTTNDVMERLPHDVLHRVCIYSGLKTTRAAIEAFGRLALGAVAQPHWRATHAVVRSVERAAAARALVRDFGYDDASFATCALAACRGRWGRTRLIEAAAHGRRREVEALLALGADVRATTVAGASAVHHAAFNGHASCIAVLAEAGAPVDERLSCSERTPDHCSLAADDPALAMDGDDDDDGHENTDDEFEAALRSGPALASNQRGVRTWRMYLPQCARFELADDSKYELLADWSRTCRETGASMHLVRSMEDDDGFAHDNATMVVGISHRELGAARRARRRVLALSEATVARAAAPTTPSPPRRLAPWKQPSRKPLRGPCDTALHLAVARGHVETARALLSAGARANTLGAEGRTPLALALDSGGRSEDVIDRTFQQQRFSNGTIRAHTWEAQSRHVSDAMYDLLVSHRARIVP